VDTISRKLKPELVGRNGSEIAMLRESQGADAVTIPSRATKLIYSGDTPIERDGRYDNTEILIHEATFLEAAEIDPDNPKRNKHSSLDQVIEMAAENSIQHLILGHFSSRYSFEQIDAAITHECQRCDLTIPVYRVLPGIVGRDILSTLKLPSTE
jgi:ribonuclease Z